MANNGAHNVLEYAHGGTTPIATLTDGGASPEACASDPTTGNLAVVETTNSAAIVAVYTNAQGTPQRYVGPGFNAYGCGYDGDSNLFVAGWNSVGTSTLEELKKGHNSLEQLTIRNGEQFYLTPDVQWDGTYLAVVETGFISEIFRFALSRKVATLVSTIKIGGAHFPQDSWIQGQTIIVPETNRPSQVLYYGYPAGGKPIKHFRGAGDNAWGATVSVAPR